MCHVFLVVVTTVGCRPLALTTCHSVGTITHTTITCRCSSAHTMMLPSSSDVVQPTAGRPHARSVHNVRCGVHVDAGRIDALCLLPTRSLVMSPFLKGMLPNGAEHLVRCHATSSHTHVLGGCIVNATTTRRPQTWPCAANMRCAAPTTGASRRQQLA